LGFFLSHADVAVGVAMQIEPAVSELYKQKRQSVGKCIAEVFVAPRMAMQRFPFGLSRFDFAT
jgi:hypothetical protein